ncbi:MAG: hypothetical protein WCB68_21920 [Pyrinomonadaceae bacterium]
MSQQLQSAGVEGRYRTLIIIWLAIMFSIGVLWVVGTFIMQSSASAQSNGMLNLILTAIGTLLALVSLAVKQKLLAQSVEKQSVQLVSSAYIIAFAMCEGAAIFGMIDRLATNDRYYFLLFIVAVVFMLLNFPKKEHVFAATQGTGR